jgi:hypothetical protein
MAGSAASSQANGSTGRQPTAGRTSNNRISPEKCLDWAFVPNSLRQRREAPFRRGNRPRSLSLRSGDHEQGHERKGHERSIQPRAKAFRQPIQPRVVAGHLPSVAIRHQACDGQRQHRPMVTTDHAQAAAPSDDQIHRRCEGRVGLPPPPRCCANHAPRTKPARQPSARSPLMKPHRHRRRGRITIHHRNFQQVALHIGHETTIDHPRRLDAMTRHQLSVDGLDDIEL